MCASNVELQWICFEFSFDSLGFPSSYLILCFVVPSCCLNAFEGKHLCASSITTVRISTGETEQGICWKMYALMFMLFTFSVGASLSNFRRETPLTIMVPAFCFNQMPALLTHRVEGLYSRSLSNCLVAHSNCIQNLVNISPK